MEDHERIREEIAQYALYGSTSNDSVIRHLEICELCASEFLALSQTIDAITRSSPFIGSDWLDESQLVQDLSLQGLAPIYRLEKLEKSRNRFRVLGTAASLVAVLAIAFSLISPFGHGSNVVIKPNSGNNAAPTGIDMVLMAKNGATTGKAVAQYRGWGAQLQITATGLTPMSDYTVIVYSGQKDQMVGGWSGGSTGKVSVYVATSFQVQRISRIVVLDSNGSPILRSV